MDQPALQMLLQRASACFEARNFPEALALCEQVLREDRKNIRAMVLQAQVASAQGHDEEAAQMLLRCMRVHPRDAKLPLLLASLRRSQGQYKKAVAIYEKVLKGQPGHPEAVAGLADAFELRGSRDKAAALLEPLVRAGRIDAEMARVYATVKAHAGEHETAVEIARHHAGDERASPLVRRRLHFIAGQALEKLDRIDEAFAAYESANALIPAPFDARAVEQEADRLISVFSAQALAGLPRAGNTSELPVFVVGMPRSGSTLIERIIDAHPAGHGVGEHPAMAQLLNRIPTEAQTTRPYPEFMAELTPGSLDALAASYLDEMSRAARRAKRIVDKLLSNYRRLGLIAMLLPRARVIHCRRDPIDTCWSCYAVNLDPFDHPYASSLRDLGLVYAQYVRLMEHWRGVLETLDVPLLEVTYESLTADQEAVTRQIVDFCGLPWDDACLRFHESRSPVLTLSYDQVRRPMYASSVGRARRFDAHLGLLRAALGGLASA